MVALGILEGRWKAIKSRGGAAAAAAAGDVDLLIAVEFRGMSEWQDISRRLAATPGVEELEVAGLSARGARVTLRYSDALHNGQQHANYMYFGGQAGLGLELQVSQRFSLYADMRGFLRGRIDGDTRNNPEFTRPVAGGGTQTTNSSAGLMSTAGMVIYF